MKPWLLIDAPNLAYRAYYSTGGLTHNGKLTGVVFGFLRELCSLADRFDTDRVGFCFDGGKLLRTGLFPGYKMRDDTEERKEVKRQIKALRDEVLPAVGFRNLWHAPGYEADDLMAAAVERLTEGGREAVLVSGDHDLFQLLHKPGVSIYDPKLKKVATHESFLTTLRITPAFWPKVKALAGCTSDRVPGLGGVGEATAIKFFNGSLAPHLKAYQRSQAAVNDPTSVYHRNLKLVTLPFPGTPTVRFAKDELSREKWRAVCTEYGMKSLINQTPVGGKAGRSLLRSE